jgi:hypothetical protein
MVLGSGDPTSVRILRTQADYIVSEEGGKFDAHRDFELLAGEGLKALVLVICLEAPIRGGELVLSPGSDEAVIVPYERGMLLLFPCAVEHSASPVLRGRKRILKFDVLTHDPLRWLDLPCSPQGRVKTASVALLASSLSALGALIDFHGIREETVKTDLLSRGELWLAAQLFLGKPVADAGDVETLKEVLERLSCPESVLPPDILFSLCGGASVALPSVLSPSPFLERPFARLAFAASSHRRRKPEVEDVVYFAVADCSRRSAIFFGEGALDSWELPSSLEVNSVYLAVLEATVSYLEAAGVDRIQASPRGEQTFPVPFWSAESHGEWAQTTVPQVRALIGEESVEGDLVALGRACCVALRREKPYTVLTGEIDEYLECNDGDSYSALRYETVVLRGGFVLCPPGSEEAAAPLSWLPRLPRRADNSCAVYEKRCAQPLEKAGPAVELSPTVAPEARLRAGGARSP